MARQQTTLATLLPRIKNHPELPLVFTAGAKEIGAGYHVTELKQVSIRGIDCGGRRSAWSETHLQLLDGAHGKHMQTEKFTSIARKSITALDGLPDAPLFVEFAPSNRGLRRYTVTSADVQQNRVVVSLTEDRANCKPYTDTISALTPAQCCGSNSTPTRCCA